MSSSGESASPGVSLSPGFLGSGLAPGLGMTGTPALGSTLAATAAALAFSFSSFAFWASWALVSFSGLAATFLCASAFTAALIGGLTALLGLAATLAGFAA